VEFEEALNQVLLYDLPHRETVVEKSAQHLALIEEANRHFNLTRITCPREAAIKHVLDSVMPWRMFQGARAVLDAGTGAGFPGIPLALVLPEVQFTLAESTQKKARFVEASVSQLALANVTVVARRAEELVREVHYDIVTARAVAPLSRMLSLGHARMLLYKGPDAEQEIADAASEVRKRRARVKVAMRYELPESQGSRTVIEVSYAR
jgi:16S rRNA (guanine527-N7)-methyltransferase